jgi:hypothetical protein
LSETFDISVLLSVRGKYPSVFMRIVSRKADREALDVWSPGSALFAIVGDLKRNVERSK